MHRGQMGKGAGRSGTTLAGGRGRPRAHLEGAGGVRLRQPGDRAAHFGVLSVGGFEAGLGVFATMLWVSQYLLES